MEARFYTESQRFALGMRGAAITQFKVEPKQFEISEAITLSLSFENTGTLSIDGAAVFEVWEEGGEQVTEFRQAFSDLEPGEEPTFEEIWDTSAAAEGTYQVIAYVTYGSTATAPVAARVTTRELIYLPLISSSDG